MLENNVVGVCVDIVITRKKKNKTWYAISAVMAVPLIFAVNYMLSLGQSDFSVDRDELVFGEIQRGTFHVSVRGNGVLAPNEIQWIASSVTHAKVERVLVKPGNAVKAGDVIVELSNPKLEKALLEEQWELEALEAENWASQVSEESQVLAQEAHALDAKLQYESSVLKFNAETVLQRQSIGSIAEINYQRTRMETRQLKQRMEISQARLEKQRASLVAHNNARAARLKRRKKILERIQQEVEDLQVKVAIDSIVLEMPLEPGQRISLGNNIAKLAKKGALIAELYIPEIHIEQVTVGLPVMIDTRNSQISGKVSRVDPAVIEGSVQVDVALIDPLPLDARPDLSVDGEINVTEIDNTLYVERPLFSQRHSETQFYRLSENNRFAEQVKVVVGSGSASQIQILQGLEEGDKIIISDPTRFESYKSFRLNN